MGEEEQQQVQRCSNQLLEAVRRGDADGTRRVLLQGAPVNAVDKDGWMPLHYCASQGEAEVCRVLLEYQGDANAALPDLSTPLMLAVEEAHLKVAILLLEVGALTKCKDEDGFTAMSRCDPDIKKELLRFISAGPASARGD